MIEREAFSTRVARNHLLDHVAVADAQTANHMRDEVIELAAYVARDFRLRIAIVQRERELLVLDDETLALVRLLLQPILHGLHRREAMLDVHQQLEMIGVIENL